jgi:glycosyltransferase involved in cell wall biosynthesis
MNVSILNLNLVARDAIGGCIINQVRFFQKRGDEVRVYVGHPPNNVPASVKAATRVVALGDLIGGREEHFRLSDLFIYHYPGHYNLLESIRGIERGTVIFYYHNVTPPELWGSDRDRELLIRGIEGTVLAHYADLCITVSPFNQQDLVERVGVAPEHVTVLPLAVPLAHFQPGERDPELVRRYGLEGRRVLLYVGRMAGNKRIDLLVEALAQIKRQFPGARLLLVGDDRSAPAFREVMALAQDRAEDLGVLQDVVWTGMVDDLPAHYRLADVFVTASLHEGFGLPLIEAMACGVPVVASHAGAMPWVIGDAGLLCEPGNARDLAEKVLTVLEDGDRRQLLVEQGLRWAQTFSLEHYERGLADIVDQAVLSTLPALPPAEEWHTAAQIPSASGRQGLLLHALATEVDAASDVAQRGYVIRSKAPLLGPLIAWVRRNLTSHLREPYLDPIIERQVEVNRRTAEWMQRAAKALDAAARRQADLESRVLALEAHIEEVTRHLKGEKGETERES